MNDNGKNLDNEILDEHDITSSCMIARRKSYVGHLTQVYVFGGQTYYMPSNNPHRCSAPPMLHNGVVKKARSVSACLQYFLVQLDNRSPRAERWASAKKEKMAESGVT